MTPIASYWRTSRRLRELPGPSVLAILRARALEDSKRKDKPNA